MRKENASPPSLFLRFFRWYCHPALHRNIEGDLLELYQERVSEQGKKKADWQFRKDVLLLFRPGIIRPSNHQINSYGMIKSYFKIGWRNLLKNKGYSMINIGGLALGMAVAIVIALWVFDELSFNTYYKNYDSVAQVMKGGTYQGKYYAGQTSLPFPLINELEANYGSNFKHVIPAAWGGGWDGVLSSGDVKVTKNGLYIGEGAPEAFSWKMIYGSWAGLKNIQSIMISESTAKALFGNNDPMGKTIRINNQAEVLVSGVYEDFPKNTAFYGKQFFQPWAYLVKDATWLSQQGWENHFLTIYVQLADHTTFDQVSGNIEDAEQKAIKDIPYMKDELKYNQKVLLMPMKDWHLRSDFKEGVLQSGPVQMVWFIGSIGGFVLLLACINFMNLSTARSEKRGKEVGIRKTIGSVRIQLIGHFFSESFLVVFLAFVFSAIIVVLTLPWFNLLSGKMMTFPWQLGWFWLSVITFLLLTGCLAGVYPALYLSSFNPVKILKGTYRAHRFSSLPRKILVVVQFTVSIMLIACTGVIYNQLMYVKNRPVGYTREGLVMIGKKSNAFTEKRDVIRAELRKTGAVAEIGESGGSVTSIWSENGGFTWPGKSITDEEGFATLNVSPEFGKTVGWQFIDGRDFSSEMASDSSGLVVNEAAAKYMKLKNPVGEIVHWTNRPWGMDKDFHIVGVIKDMLMGSPYEPARASVYFTSGWKNLILLRVTPGMAMSDAIPKIETVFRDLIPEIPFDFEFADKAFAAKFENEERIGKLAAVFATLAIVISCLGLFGLASFVAEQRTKEIGIRKVLGASVSMLWRLLSTEFVVLVILSCMVAIPLSWYILSNGLKQYEYKTDIGWWILASAGFGALVITLATVSFQSVKAALANPVNSLRTE